MKSVVVAEKNYEWLRGLKWILLSWVRMLQLSSPKMTRLMFCPQKKIDTSVIFHCCYPNFPELSTIVVSEIFQKDIMTNCFPYGSNSYNPKEYNLRQIFVGKKLQEFLWLIWYSLYHWSQQKVWFLFNLKVIYL
jgi:hypothetical protein